MQIRDVMTRDVKVVNPDTPLRDAARMMREIDTGFLPVGQNDRLVGTVTDRDITVRCVAEGSDPNNTMVRQAMTDELVYCYEDQDTAEAAELMGRRQIRRLPILNREKRLVGVLSLGDIAHETGDEGPVAEALDQISEHKTTGGMGHA